MLVEMVLTGKVKDVKPEAADVLFRAKAARPAYQTRQVVADASEVEQIRYSDDEVCQTFKVESREEISPRTGKPKRRYKRRDMKAEE